MVVEWSMNAMNDWMVLSSDWMNQAELIALMKEEWLNAMQCECIIPIN